MKRPALLSYFCLKATLYTPTSQAGIKFNQTKLPSVHSKIQ